MNYIFHILIMINIYLILALSLNLPVGYTGLLSLAHASFYGIGAYISTLLMMKAGLGFIPSLLLSILGSILLGLVISIPSLRLKGDYFMLSTLAFQIITFTILYNWVSLTRGPYGISGIPMPKIFGIVIDSIPSFLIFSTFVTLICLLLLYLLSNSSFGRVLKAIREDELSALSIGKNTTNFKITSFTISAGFAAVSGVLFAGYMTYIDPTSFTLAESIFILSIIIIGGSGNFLGPLVGTAFMILLPEILRFLRIPDSIAANMRQIIYGLLIIIILRFRPQGLKGEYRFR
jgi:branched-chain amino acid transport system permease protein